MRIRSRLNIIASILLTIGVFLSSPQFSAAADTGDLGWLQEPQFVTNGRVSVVIFLENDDLRDQVERTSSVGPLSRSVRIKSVSRSLQSYVPSQAAEIKQYLDQVSTEEVVRFWIVPAFSATLDQAQILDLAAMPGVYKIVPDLGIENIEPVEIRTSDAIATSSSSHLQMLNVPYLWSLGLTGAGRLVCSFDTGVEQSHPALSGNWRGNSASLSSAWFSTITPNSLPTDNADHGTHTMGTMIGVDGADTIGVAPGAEWITAGVIDQGKSLQGTFSDILAAFQWALNPDGDTATTDDVPDVILNSWGVPASLLGPCDDTFFAAIDNVEAAGIVCIFSAGNEGPAPSTLRNPANRASSPLNAFSVGAVDNDRVVASFSSRGPGGCGLTSIKPEIVAPGIAIRSASKTGGYKLMSGTSMAAPFIAGLVALCRQYSPDATVEEIKWAIINASEDLGVEGEDNAYGYGFPDAAKLLEYLSSPDNPHFQLVGSSVSDDGIASPGETVELNLTLIRTGGSVELVTGHLIAENETDIQVVSGVADFFFGFSGTTSNGSQAFQLQLNPDLLNGSEFTLALSVRDTTGQVYDSLNFVLPIGFAPNGTMADHSSAELEFTVSDFGQYGLAPGSIYNVGGQGFRYAGSDNLLYEAGIIIGRSSLQLSSSVRDENGLFTPSDFVPEIGLSDEILGTDFAVHRTARMVDEASEVSIPVAVNQITSDFGPAGDDGILLIRYQLVNTSLTTINDLYFGFLSDFDMIGGSEQLSLTPDLNLISQTSTIGQAIGLLGLSGLTSFHVVENVGVKTGLSRLNQFEMISSPGTVIPDQPGDYLTIISGGPFSLVPGDSVEIAIALLAGADVDQVNLRAIRARELYMSPTGIDFPLSSLPDGFQLHQNYPNPFNPTTLIAFDLPVAGDVSLQVFNLLGQQVRQLHSGYLSVGNHLVEWDGRTDNGSGVASGVYFYRLTTSEYSQSRKMVLLR
ncbi:MAG: S8 family peptidase [candidate division Zixibacteria bacterium]|nr:S8 family peptidase [candidate division Zixibacteria bacterium]